MAESPLSPTPSSDTLGGSSYGAVGVQALASYENSKESWVSYIDETTGQEYWYNSVTGETSE